MPTPTSIFVYGTLKQGELCCRKWPRRPVQIEPVFVAGELYDLGTYPALVAGNHCVRGELWTFAPDDLPPTLAALDAFEGYADTPHDLYIRRIVVCEAGDGSVIAAWAYLFARIERLATAPRILPDARGCCCWNSAGS
jgi:gamma-glutamylcyclotransferase (GGCT)/AIG2-like uncharacterized protein YtfP